ncbi:MAG: SPFH domain-containing protein [Pirellulales bacterium]
MAFITFLKCTIFNRRGSFGLRAICGAAGVLLLLTYCISGVTTIPPGEIAVVYRWGRVSADSQAGPIRPPGILLALPWPIDRVCRLPAKKELSVPMTSLIGGPLESEVAGQTDSQHFQPYLLTGDQSLINISCSAKYVITSPLKYLTCSSNTDDLIQRLLVDQVQSVLRRATVSDILQRKLRDGEQSDESLAEAVRRQLVREVSLLECGIEVTRIEIDRAEPPAEIRDAFDAVQTAQIDQATTSDRMIAKANELVADAESISRQTVAEALGRVETIASNAHREVVDFQAVVHLADAVPTVAAQDQLRREVLQSIVQQPVKTYVVPRNFPGRELRISLPAQGSEDAVP